MPKDTTRYPAPVDADFLKTLCELFMQDRIRSISRNYRGDIIIAWKDKAKERDG